MSDVTAALLTDLLEDLSGVLDDYQLSLCRDPDSVIWPDATVPQAQAFYLAKSLFKKFNEQDSPSKEACDRALSKFLEVNDRCGKWELKLDSIRDEELVNGVRHFMERFWFTDGESPLVTDLGKLFEVGRLGSGMNRFARDADLYTKLWDSPLSVTTESLAFSWHRLVSRDIRWAAAERHRANEYSTQLVGGNKLSFVNKNVTVARCISTEPTINMWFQLGMAAVLQDRLVRFFGIDIRQQADVNRELARVGSLTGGFATIDLESASDSIALSMLDHIMPKSFRVWLDLLRSPTTTLPTGEEVRLNMISTMGNGYTFPLQTIIFSAIVATAYKHLGIPLKGWGPASLRSFGVFGDDIIVDTRAASLVLRILRILGFVTNRSKTFVEGPFRESCGADWFYGQHCRGVYLKTLRTKQDCCVAVNLLNRWSALTGIWLPKVVQAISRLRGKLHLVPPDEADDAGVHVPLDMACGMKHQYSGLVRYHKYAAVASYFLVREDGSIECGQRVRPRRSNPEGLQLAFLHGDIRDYRASLRQRRVRYITKRKVTPSWDHLPSRSRALGCEWRRWSDAAYYNLTL